MRVRPSSVIRRAVAFILVSALACAISLVGHARQARTVTDGVYSDGQATRGQQIYQAQCVMCHGNALEGAVGPPLAGDGFLTVWATRPLADLVGKIETTMPPQQPGSVSRQQAIDLVAYVLRAGKFRAGQTELSAVALGQIAFPASRASATSAPATAAASFAVAGNLAQLMRGVTFPNANILFNVQVKDPAASKPSVPVPFDYVAWGSTVYYGWQVVDQAALALVETTPLFLLPGRRCENGRPVPVDRPNWQQYTAALVDAGREAYRASQSRNVDAVVKMVDQLNATCDNCHKVYRDGGKEGTSAGAARCQ
ncbi:MAG TPA: cytochrome c [Vicinamibacterales bacterium]|nr:cytochrome c [Vicinamibacterales bacterium]